MNRIGVISVVLTALGILACTRDLPLVGPSRATFNCAPPTEERANSGLRSAASRRGVEPCCDESSTEENCERDVPPLEPMPAYEGPPMQVSEECFVECHDIALAYEWGFEAVDLLGAAFCDQGCTTFPLTPQAGNTVANAITRNRYGGACGEAQEWLMGLQVGGKIRTYTHQGPGDMADLHDSPGGAEVHLSDLSMSSVNEAAMSLYHEAYHHFSNDNAPGFEARADSFARLCISTA